MIARVLLPERAGGGVARVRRRLLALGREPLVQLAEARQGHVDLAAHLDERRDARRPRMRSGIEPIVRRLTVTSSPALAVAARRAAHEDAVLVDEVDREAVDLRLGDVGDRLVRVEPLAHVVGPLPQLVLGRHLVERPHRLRGGRPSGTCPTAARRPAASGESAVVQLGVLALEPTQLVEEPVVLGVGDLGVVEDVVRGRGGARARARSSSTRVADLRGRQGAPPGRGRARPAPRGEPLLARGSRPSVTATAKQPAAFAASTSNGESPTYAASDGSAPSRSSACSERLRVRLVPARVLGADDDVEGLCEPGQDVERELDGDAALGGHDPEAPPFVPQSPEQRPRSRRRPRATPWSGSLCARYTSTSSSTRLSSSARICAIRPGPPTAALSSSSGHLAAEHGRRRRAASRRRSSPRSRSGCRRGRRGRPDTARRRC